MIKKKENKWCVYDSTGKQVLGCHSSKEAALRQLRAIETNKNKK